jgi:hypothetical protein
MGASLYSPELVDAICARLETGETMADICRGDGMPAYRTVKDWIDTKPQVSAAIARAREIGFDAIAASCLAIADGPAEVQGNPCGSEDVQRDKLRIWSRLQLLAKWDPKRYGDKAAIDHTSSDGSMTPPLVVQLVGPSGHGTATAPAETN